MLNDKL